MREDAAAAANNPFLWREASAARSACRNSDSVHHDAALQQILDHAGETLLLGPIAVRARFQKDCDDDGDGDGNAMIEGNNESGIDKKMGTTSAAWVSGKVVISSKHLYFWWVSTMRAEDENDGPAAYSSVPGNREDMNTSINNNDLDLRIRAHRINLHALLAENNDDDAMAANGDGGGTGAPSAVYLQICTSADEAWHGQEDDNNHADDSGSEEQLFELTLQPVLASSATTGTAAFRDDSIQQTCQQLFDAISRMVELNPIDPNTDETGEEDGVFGGGGSWITSEHADLDGATIMAMMGAGLESGDDASDDDDDDLICCPKVNTSTKPEEVTEDERNAMLERLDNLLIVPPELEIHEGDVSDDERKGQFDDADEDDAIL